MAAALHNSNGHFRVWAMIPLYHEGYVSIEPVNPGRAAVLGQDELNHLVHDITDAARKVAKHNEVPRA